MSVDSRLMAVEGLARLPLYQLSTAGMELFHTNMLYWLATERPDASRPVWNALGLSTARVNGHTPFVRREWHHLDLVVAPADGQGALVLENKISAIPGPAQLDGYFAGLRSTQPPFSLDTARFVLLTLTPPSFTLPEPWRAITYRDLLPGLRETARNLSGPDASLVEAYADMVDQLDQVAAAYDPCADLSTPYALTYDERNALNELRLISLVEKVRAGRFAEIAAHAVADSLGHAVLVETGFTNGSGIIQSFVPGPAGRRFGWQIQGGQFRLAIRAANEDPQYGAGLEDLVAELYGSYFDFSVSGHLGDKLSPYRRRRAWLGYRPNFVYRYNEITPGTTWNDLLGLIVWFSNHAHAYISRHQSAE